MCDYSLDDVAKNKSRSAYLKIYSALPFSISRSALLFLSVLCSNMMNSTLSFNWTLYSDSTSLMKRCVLPLLMNNFLLNLNPLGSISFVEEIFPLQLPPFLSYIRTHVS